MPVRKITGDLFAPPEPALPAEPVPPPPLGQSTYEASGVPDDKVRVVSMHLAYSSGSPLPRPKEMRVEDLLAQAGASNNPGDHIEQAYRDRIRSPLTAIRAFCVLCVGGPGAVSKCENTGCAIWAFRMGNNPLFGKLKSGNAESKD